MLIIRGGNFRYSQNLYLRIVIEKSRQTIGKNWLAEGSEQYMSAKCTKMFTFLHLLYTVALQNRG